MKTAIGIFLISSSLMVGAQTFVTAKVVTLTGDTLRGEAQVNAKKPMLAYEKIIFKDAAGIQKIYKADKVVSYMLEGDSYFSMDSDGEPRFYRVLSKGAVNLYELGVEMQIGEKIVTEKAYYLSYSENKRLVEVKRKKFKKQINECLKENPALAAKYVAEEFDAEKAIAILNEFNSWKASQT